MLCLAVTLPVMVMAMEEEVLREVNDMEQEWQMWKAKFGKVYSPREEVFRRQVFEKRVENILAHNSKYPAQVSYYRGLNQFSDFTLDEFRSYNKLSSGFGNNNQSCGSIYKPPQKQLSAHVDWRLHNMVTGIKNQGMCGSCWAFSATGSVEGQHAKKTGKLLSLSEQQLVECSNYQGNEGCEGGFINFAFHYIEKQPGGLETEWEYPYTSEEGNEGVCHAVPSEEKAKITGCVDIPSGNETALMYATALVGPISVGIDADHESFMEYGGGVYKEPTCSRKNLDHAVLAIGYGVYKGQDYWMIKNSWGRGWGVYGYMMMARNDKNMCGIATSASFPTV